MNNVLTKQDLVDVTGKSKRSAQRRELDFMGIYWRPRKDGSLLVLWDDVRAVREFSAVISQPREPQVRLDA